MNKNSAIYSNTQTDIYKNPENIMEMKWKDIKTQIRPFLTPIDWEKTLGITQQLAYNKFLDLSIHYYIPLVSDDAKKVTIIWIDHMMLNSWNVTMQTLDSQAIENLDEDGYAIQRIDGVIGDLLANHFAPDDIEDLHLYALTNKKFFWGASGILDKRIIQSFAKETGHSLYIIPSSIHEALLLPDLGQINKEELDQMVREVNATQVEEYDRLSDHVYYYDMATDEIYIER